jgi:amidohydrolase
MSDIAAGVRELMVEHDHEFIATLKHLHQHPELSFHEYETTAFIKAHLESLGIEILDIGLETGVVGLLKGAEDVPCIALRAVIDALPLQEESSHDYRSTIDGRMHACGHDTHTTSLLGAATILAALRSEIKGSVKFLFQPAEEVNLGAKLMMKLNCLENPKVDAVFGLHNSSMYPAGTVCVKNGPLMASVDRIEFYIKGKGGHGGVPQRSVDPVVCAAAIIQSAQTIVSRNVSPIDSAVVSICSVKAGEVNNVIPDEVVMLGTVRAYKRETQELVERRLGEITKGIAAAYGCEVVFKYIYELAVTDNRDRMMYETAMKAVSAVAEPVDPIPSTGGEDFSEYGKTGVPTFFYWLGVRNEAEDCVYPWHSPRFKADLRSLKYGAGTYAMSVFTAIEQLRKYSIFRGGL